MIKYIPELSLSYQITVCLDRHSHLLSTWDQITWDTLMTGVSRAFEDPWHVLATNECMVTLHALTLEHTYLICMFMHTCCEFTERSHSCLSVYVQQPAGHQSACPAVGHDYHAAEWWVITQCMSLNFTLFKIISPTLQPFFPSAVGSSNQRAAEARTAAQLCDSRRWELLLKESMHFTQ